MEPRWITAFVDVPAAAFDRAARFWTAVTGSELSPRRGDRAEFATLVPAVGDAFCRLQATADGTAGVHLDFHVESIDDARREAVALGATVVADHGHVLMASPAGLVFCLVADQGARVVPPPVGDPAAALGQVCIDVPAARFDDEMGFWRALLGWDDVPLERDEFFRLAEPDGLPMRVLFQRLGDESETPAAHAHLDLAAGEDRETVAGQHVALGATRIATFERWIVMRDPVGIEYCVTGRVPSSPEA